MAKAHMALQFSELTDFHAMMASVALVMSGGALGEVDGMPEVFGRALEMATSSFQASHMRFWLGSVYARACRLTGRLDDCATSATQLADSARDVPGLAYANLAFLLGHADLIRGDLRSAVTILHEALAGVEKHAVTTGLHPASCFALAEAHAKLGQPDEAASALAEARRCVPSDYLFMQTGLCLATGWALAASGSLAEAIATVQAGVIDARDRGQPTHELALLQAAVQWGDTPVRRGHVSSPMCWDFRWPMPLQAMPSRCRRATAMGYSMRRPSIARSATGRPPPTRRPRLQLHSRRRFMASAVGTPPR